MKTELNKHLSKDKQAHVNKYLIHKKNKIEKNTKY